MVVVSTGGGTAAYGLSYANAGATKALPGFAGGVGGGRFMQNNELQHQCEHVIHMSIQMV